MKISPQFIKINFLKKKESKRAVKNDIQQAKTEEKKDRLKNTLKILSIIGSAMVAINMYNSRTKNNNTDIGGTDSDEPKKPFGDDDGKDDIAFEYEYECVGSPKNKGGKKVLNDSPADDPKGSADTEIAAGKADDGYDDSDDSVKVLLALTVDGRCVELYELPNGKIISPADFHFPGWYSYDGSSSSYADYNISSIISEKKADGDFKGSNSIDCSIIKAINSVGEDEDSAKELFSNKDNEALLSALRQNMLKNSKESTSDEDLPQLLFTSLKEAITADKKLVTVKNAAYLINLTEKLYKSNVINEDEFNSFHHRLALIDAYNRGLITRKTFENGLKQQDTSVQEEDTTESSYQECYEDYPEYYEDEYAEPDFEEVWQ